MLIEKEETQLSDTEFKAMVFRKLNELTDLTENSRINRETTMNSLQTIST